MKDFGDGWWSGAEVKTANGEAKAAALALLDWGYRDSPKTAEEGRCQAFPLLKAA
jgi:hypothetical protein